MQKFMEKNTSRRLAACGEEDMELFGQIVRMDEWMTSLL